MGFATFFQTPGIAPPWLLGPIGGSKLAMLGNTLDELTGPGGKMAQAAEAGMPTKCDASLLPYIGEDRVMTQGAGETTAAFRLRLRGAMPEWQQFSGNAWGVLRQCRNQLAPNQPMIRHVKNDAVWDWYIDGASTANVPYHFRGGLGQWTWDGLSGTYIDASTVTPWWRFWVIIYSVSPTVWTTSLGTWGSTGKKWGDLTVSWGLNSPSTIFRALQSAITTYKSQGSWCRWMVISFDVTLFDPGQTSGGGINPDGTFGRWSKIVNGQYVPSRFANARYANVPE